VNGLLIVDKPAGITSHDAVSRVRRLTNVRRVGHAGTLDPMATGVLILLIGAATRLSRFAMAGHKCYRGTVRLGETTDSYDADGEILERRSVDVALPAIEHALEGFRGAILQTPPMVSAIKIQGEKLYKLARRGKEIDREPRPVAIDTIDIVSWQSPDLTLEVRCSPGTYIRSLAHDLGQALGCGAHLRCLQRTASGAFTLEMCHTLEALERPGYLEAALLPPQAALGAMPITRLTPEQEQAVRYGQAVELPFAEASDGLLQARDHQGRLVGVLQQQSSAGRADETPQEDTGLYRPIIVLPPESE
jgi:tRNA pseudouridine55 synthase